MALCIWCCFSFAIADQKLELKELEPYVDQKAKVAKDAMYNELQAAEKAKAEKLEKEQKATETSVTNTQTSTVQSGGAIGVEKIDEDPAITQARKEKEEALARIAAIKAGPVDIDIDDTYPVFAPENGSRDTFVGSLVATTDNYPGESIYTLFIVVEGSLYYAYLDAEGTYGWQYPADQYTDYTWSINWDTDYSYRLSAYDAYSDGGVSLVASDDAGNVMATCDAPNDGTWVAGQTDVDFVPASGGGDDGGSDPEWYTIDAQGTYTAATGRMTDDGGPDANYGMSTYYVSAIDVGDAGSVELTFAAPLHYENNYDYLYVDCSSDGTAEHVITGNNYPDGLVITCPGSAVTLAQSTDGSVSYEGFDMTWAAVSAPVAGCTDSSACNYDADAEADDGSCAYPDAGYDCDGNCLGNGSSGCAIAYTDGASGYISGGNEFWYTYSQGTADLGYLSTTVTTCGSYADTYLTVYSADGTALYSNDDGCWDADSGYSSASNIVLDGGLAAGDYLVQVMGYSQWSSGDFVLSISNVENQPAMGCTDTAACNYDETAENDDGSCTYPAEGYDCDGNWTADYYLINMGGSTDASGTLYDDGGANGNYSTSTNYQFTIDIGTGSLQLVFTEFNYENNYDYLGLSGCSADVDGWYSSGSLAGSVIICDGSSVTIIQDTDSSVTYSGFAMNWSEAPQDAVYGCTDESACNYNADATDDDGSCVAWGGSSACALDLVDGAASGSIAGGSQHWYLHNQGEGSYASTTLSTCGSDIDTKLYVFDAATGEQIGYNDDGCSGFGSGSNYASSITYAPALAAGSYFVAVTGYSASTAGDFVLNVSNEDAVAGCTDPYANNYNADANVDDGSCDYSCTDNEIVVVMGDNYGDGWNGGITLTIGDVVLAGPDVGCESDCDNIYDSCYGGSTETFCVATATLCLADATYDVVLNGGDCDGSGYPCYEEEISFSISDENGEIISGGAPYSGSITLPVPQSYCGDGTCDDDETCGSALDADVGCSADCGLCSWDAAIELTSAGVQDDYDDDGVIDYAVRSDWTALTDFDDCDALAADLTQDICGYYISSGYTCEELVGYGYDCSNVDNCGLCPVPDACQDAGGNSYWSGDGMCDAANNNEACGFDGGDCCCSTCDTTDFTNYDPWECGVGDGTGTYDCQDAAALATDEEYACSTTPQQQCADLGGFYCGEDNSASWVADDCITNSAWLCDDYPDCTDGADEEGCPDPPASCAGVDTGTDGLQDFVFDSDGDTYVDNAVLCDYYMYYVESFGYTCTFLDDYFGSYNADGTPLEGWGTCANADSCGLCEDTYGDPVEEEVACDETCDPAVECCTHADCGAGNYCYYSSWSDANVCYADGTYGCCYYNDSIDTDCDGDADLDDCPQDCGVFANAGEGVSAEKQQPTALTSTTPGYNPADEDMMLISKVFGFDRAPLKGPAMGGTWTNLAERKLDRMSQPKSALINIATGEVTPGTPLNSDRYVQYTLAYSVDGSNWYYVNDLVFNNYTIYGFDQHQDTYWSVYGINNDGAVTGWSNTTSAQAGDCGDYQDCDGRCFAEAYLSWVGDDSCDGSTAPYGYNFACEAWDCDDGDCADECGACEGSGAGFTCWDNSIVCSEEDCPLQCSAGDANDDGSINVTDIVTMVAYILGNTDTIGDCADVNGDGGINVTDIVGTVSIILGGNARTADATSAEIIKTADSAKLKADGFVGAVQMTLSHGDDFSIELTDDAMVADYKTTGDLTTLIIVTPGSEELFTAQGEFKVEEAVVANSSTTIDASIATPEVFGLSSAYPNPFNPTTSVALSLPNDSYVSITVYNVIGQTVATLADGYMTADVYSFSWDASSVPSGAYFIRAEAGNDVGVQKVMLLK
jgi:hypothetical protein